jgi:hypothetical protein
MVDDRSAPTSRPALPSSSDNAGRSAWRFLLPVVWAGLGARLVVALARNESVREDFLSLALVAFFMTTAVLGSRVWLWLHDHWDRLPLARTHHPTGS